MHSVDFKETFSLKDQGKNMVNVKLTMKKIINHVEELVGKKGEGGGIVHRTRAQSQRTGLSVC